ncbi:MAG TPA: AAA family ATPase [Kaistia sp.]|nr:AAA family ATPase [Kaistia sp.]
MTLVETEERPADDQEALRAEVRLIMATEKLTQQDIAKETGIPYGTFTPWMGGTYKGDTADKAALVRRWLETRRVRARTISVLPDAPGFVATPTAMGILDLLNFAQAAPDFVVVVGGAGIGKTSAIEAQQRRAPNVFVITADPIMASPNNMLVGVAEAIGIVEKRSAWVSRAICNRLRGSSGLIIIDEAQHLSTSALDQLRSIHDTAKIGIAVAGNESLYARLQGAGGARGSQFAQLFSRVGMRINQPKSKAKDITALLDAWGLQGDPIVRLLKQIAAKPGALRNMTKTIRLAHMLAAGSGETLDERHVRAAWEQLSATNLDSDAA